MKGGVVRGGSKEVCINQIVWIGCVGKLSSARVCCVVWIWWIQWLCWLWLFSVCVQISCVNACAVWTGQLDSLAQEEVGGLGLGLVDTT